MRWTKKRFLFSENLRLELMPGKSKVAKMHSFPEKSFENIGLGAPSPLSAEM